MVAPRLGRLTPEQRRLIRDGFKPAAVSHKELV